MWSCFLTPYAFDKRVKEVNTIAPLYTLLLCLPAALELIACGGGLAALGSPTAQSPTRQTVGRPRGEKRTMRQNGRMPGKQALSLAALLEQEGGKP
jgi:hypothetical protein